VGKAKNRTYILLYRNSIPELEFNQDEGLKPFQYVTKFPKAGLVIIILLGRLYLTSQRLNLSGQFTKTFYTVPKHYTCRYQFIINWENHGMDST
jgi:hypothetical protein